MSTAVVTDSTTSLSTQLRSEHGITAVPLRVVVNGRDRAEDDADIDLVVDVLRRKSDISTSRPSPLTFLRAYE